LDALSALTGDAFNRVSRPDDLAAFALVSFDEDPTTELVFVLTLVDGASRSVTLE